MNELTSAGRPGFLNRLTIRKLLYYWGLVCSVAIILAALTTIITDKIVNTRQNALVGKAVQIEELSRNITESVAKFILRKSNILQAGSPEEFERYDERNYLERIFQGQIEILTGLLADNHDAIIIVSDLRGLYQNFLANDKLMTDNRLAILQSHEELKAKIYDLEILVQQISNMVEEVSGIISLETSRTRKKLRNAIESGFLSEGESQKLNQDILMGDQARILRATHQVQQSVSAMVEFSHKIILEEDRDELINVRGNEIEQQKNLLITALGWLKTDLEEFPHLLKKIGYIELSVENLMAFLVEDEKSIYQLRLQNLRLKTNMDNSIILANNSLDHIMRNLQFLSSFAESLSEQAAYNTEKTNRLSHIIITGVSLIVVLILLAGIKIIRSRINNPLHKISDAVDNLSKGILTSRLNKADFSGDEFAALAADFNYFAEKNQELIVELSNAKDALGESESRTRAILENALVGIAHLENRQFISVNQRFEAMFGYNRDEIKDLYTEILFPDKDEYEAIGKAAYSLLQQGDTYQSEWEVRRKDGNLFWCAISAKSIIDGKPEKGTIWLYEDISQRKKSEEQLKKLASIDALTGLPNRSLFLDRLLNSLNYSKRFSENLAVLFIDLDRFKQVNDSLGHAVGDQLLQHVAQRLQGCIRRSDTVARLGGDEFTVLLTGLKTPDYSAKVAENILLSLAKPVLIENREINISPSIGISVYPDDAGDISTLLQNADSAMYHAKRVGRNNFQFYNKTMNVKSLERLTFENRLRQAVRNNDYVLHYQPLVETESRRTIGYEALLRLKNNNLDLTMPAEFIPILEDTGLIIPVSEWMLETASLDIQKLNTALNKDIRLSVNLSARQFRHNNLAKQLREIIEKTKMNPRNIDFEITETVLMTESEYSQQILQELHAMGATISLDDFGTGYSSLAYLKKFPIDTIKIDRSFVRDVLTDPGDAAICEAILAIAHRLKMQVVAEGIESEQQLDFFIDRGCPVVQGYLFGQPASLDKILSDTVQKQDSQRKRNIHS